MSLPILSCLQVTQPFHGALDSLGVHEWLAYLSAGINVVPSSLQVCVCVCVVLQMACLSAGINAVPSSLQVCTALTVILTLRLTRTL